MKRRKALFGGKCVTLPCSSKAYFRAKNGAEANWSDFCKNMSQGASKLWRVRLLPRKSPLVYPFLEAMLFASHAMQNIVRTLVLSIGVLMIFRSSAPAQTPHSTQATTTFSINAARAKGAELTAINVQNWNFGTQTCDAPLNDSRTITIYLGVPTNTIAGRIVVMRLTGANASDFRIVIPDTTMLPWPVSATNGANVQLQFSGSAIGVQRTAQLLIATQDLSGNPVPDTILVNLSAIRQSTTFQLLQQVFDFGTLPPNTSSQATFQYLRNTGSVPLTWEIPLGVDPNFDVINTIPAPLLDSTPGRPRRFISTIQPGEILSITAQFKGQSAGQLLRSFTFSPLNRTCNIFQTFEFTASTLQNPPNITVRNLVQGVETPVRDKVIFFGNFACPNTDAPFKDTTLKIYNSGQVPLVVTSATFSHPDFQIINPPAISQKDSLVVTYNTSRDITVRYTPRTPSVNDIFATLTLLSNSPTGTPVGSTTVTFQVRKDSVRIAPSRQVVNFGTVVRGASVPAQTLVIYNTGTVGQAIQPFPSTMFTATYSPANVLAGDSVLVTLRPINTNTAGVFQETWTLTDNCFRQTQITVQMTVNRPNPTIGLAIPVSFGRLVCSNDTVITQSITNTGNDANDLVISGLSIVGTSGGAFSLVQTPTLPLSIPSGQQRSVQIRFRPNRTGAITDTLRILSNAEGTTTFNAALNGSKDSVSFRLSRTAVNFVNILPNAAASDVITIFNTGTVPITWGATSFTIPNPFSLQIVPPVTPVGGSSQITVNFLGAMANVAPVTGTLADTCGRAQSITASATILPPYISATEDVSFGTLTCETSSSGQISITNTGGQDLVVSAISSSLFQPQTSILPLRLPRGVSASVPIVFRPLPTTQGAANATTTITSNAANGSTTTTLRAVKNTIDFEFVKRFGSDLPNAVSRSLGDAPPNTPITDTLTVRNTGNLPISWQAPFASPDGLFTITNVAPNPTPPNATAVMTVRYEGSACPDSKITANGIEILRNYGFDCMKQPARVTLSARTLAATARLWTDSIAANISDTVSLPIRLRNPQYLRQAGVTGFSFVLRYDFSTLVPLDTPRGMIVGTSRLQPVTLMLPTPIPADSVLGRVRFQATLGSTSGTLISIDSLRAIGTSGASCIIFDNTALQGKFTLGGICLEGGMRLVTKSTTTTVLAQSKPNPASEIATIDFSLLERGLTTITVYSVMGEVVLQAMAERLEPGSYSLDMDVSRLPSGVYFYVLQTPTDRKTRRMEVIR